jgi:hypothetical protein
MLQFGVVFLLKSDSDETLDMNGKLYDVEVFEGV